MKYKLLKINAVMCPNCRYILISRYTHDYVMCPCYRKSDELVANYKGKKETKKGYTKKFLDYLQTMHGCTNDGGNDYQHLGCYGNDRPIALKIYEAIP